MKLTEQRAINSKVKADGIGICGGILKYFGETEVVSRWGQHGHSNGGGISEIFFCQISIVNSQAGV